MIDLQTFTGDIIKGIILAFIYLEITNFCFIFGECYEIFITEIE